jgi:hypothetical protein
VSRTDQENNAVSHIETRTYTDEGYRSLGMLGCWSILLDIANAVRYEFAQNRLPEPGKAIDVAEAEAHISNIEKEWAAEKSKRDFSNQWSSAPPFSAMPQNAKLYLHSVLRDEWHDNVKDSTQQYAQPDQPDSAFNYRYVH